MFTSTNNVARLSRLAGLAATVASAAPAFGQLIAYDGFAYPTGTPLTAVIPGGLGWVGNWNVASPGNWTVDAFGSTYVSAGLSLAHAGNRIMGTSAGLQRTMSLGTPLGNSTQTVWVSFIAQQTLGATGQNWLGVKLPCAAAPGVNSYLFMGKPYANATWGLDAGSIASHRVGSQPVYSKAFIVARMDLRAGLDDVRLWVNPPLGVTPTNASASVTALNYGNFEGITKAITEVGAVSGLTSGNIDELRVGLAYESVAPIQPGRMFKGFQGVPLGEAILENTSPPMTVTHIGGTGQDGVEITLASLGGSSLRIAQEFTVPPGAYLAVAHGNWNGQTTHTTTLQRTAAGNHELVADFSGNPSGPVTSVNMVIYDGAGNMIQNTTTPGPIVVGNINAIHNGGGLCTDGLPPRWYLDEIIDPFTHSIVTTSVFGCPNGFAAPNANTVVFTANVNVCSGCSLDAGGTTGTHSINVTASGLNSFTVEDVAAEYHGAFASALGDAMISQTCDDGSACSDPSTQRLRIANIGGTGNDGVEVRLPAGASTATYSLGSIASLAKSEAGEVIQGMHVTTQSGAPKALRMASVSDGSGWIRTSIDASELETTQVAFTVRSNGVVVGSGVAHPQQIVWKWHSLQEAIDLLNAWHMALYGNGGAWPYLSAEFSDFESCSVTVGGPGGGTYVGDQIEIQVLDGLPVASFNSATITGKDLGYGIIDITSLVWGGIAAACSADFDSDGTVDFFDYDAFVNAFESGAPNADFDQDGSIDFFDYDAFVIAFEAGC